MLFVEYICFIFIIMYILIHVDVIGKFKYYTNPAGIPFSSLFFPPSLRVVSQSTKTACWPTHLCDSDSPQAENPSIPSLLNLEKKKRKAPSSRNTIFHPPIPFPSISPYFLKHITYLLETRFSQPLLLQSFSHPRCLIKIKPSITSPSLTKSCPSIHSWSISRNRPAYLRPMSLVVLRKLQITILSL